MNVVTQTDQKTLTVQSEAFANNGLIPGKYTCDGINVNPPLAIRGIPNGAKCLAIIVDDPDAPRGIWLHWLVWDIPIKDYLKENSIPGTQGINDFGQLNYGGPCPPSGAHRYFFKVFALDRPIGLAQGAGRRQLEAAIRGHVLAYGELVGLYKRTK